MLQFGRNVDAFIVGSSLKKDGQWQNPLEPNQVLEFAKTFDELREPADRLENMKPTKSESDEDLEVETD